MEIKGFFKYLIDDYINNYQAWYSGDYKESVDFEEFITYHKLDGLLNLCLKKYHPVLQQPRLASFARDEEEITARLKSLNTRNQRYLTIATEVMERLDAIGVEFVFLKGLSLIVNNPADIHHRRFSDLDLLVPKERLSDVENLLLTLGYQYGHCVQGKIIKASRVDVIYQRMHTHEIHNLTLVHDDKFISNIDVNFHFSWKCPDFDENTMRVMNFNDVSQYVIKRGFNNKFYPVLNDAMQFIHLCCHLYNESRFFALDREYTEGKRYDLKLFRLVDIIFLLHRVKINPLEIYKHSVEFNCLHKINYVLKAISVLYDDALVAPFNELFFFSAVDLDFFYHKDGTKEYYKRSIAERVYNSKN